MDDFANMEEMLPLPVTGFVGFFLGLVFAFAEFVSESGFGMKSNGSAGRFDPVTEPNAL